MAATLPPPCGEAGAERVPPLTDHRDGRTRCLRGTPQHGRSRASGAAPPAGSLGRCSPATSGLSLQDPGLRLEVPGSSGPEHHVATEPAHSFVLPLEILVMKGLFRFLAWVKCGAQG